MKTHPSLRVLAALALLSLAACDVGRSPTAAEPAAAPRFNTHPAPSLTVTNSGGYPLISWTALTGATSYSVTLVITEQHVNRATADGTSTDEQYSLGSTTGTSFLDSFHPYTGVSHCRYVAYPWVTHYWYEYRVVATFADGSSEEFNQAPIAQC